MKLYINRFSLNTSIVYNACSRLIIIERIKLTLINACSRLIIIKRIKLRLINAWSRLIIIKLIKLTLINAWTCSHLPLGNACDLQLDLQL